MDAVRSAINDTRTDLALTIETIAVHSERSRSETKIEREEDTETSRDGGPAYHVDFSLPCDPHNVKGFGGTVYGVATVVQKRSKLRPSLSEKGCGNDTVKLAIIKLFTVNGTSKPYRSPESSMIGTRHDRKLAVHYELPHEAGGLEDRGFAVVIVGDVNVAAAARCETAGFQ
ncbi:hypothetical protein EV127DRAFT_481997 [Xylaria flabelliformis]|nr:hypothetical protein EV127DRAFT_481997 [Xylaria flabelliformis]